MIKNKSVKILVCTHKPALCLNDDDYMPIQVGCSEVDFNLGFQNDNEGNNIGGKHFHYGEFTGIYWAWKNMKDIDYIGWCHYRRYFCLNEHRNYPREVFPIDESELSKMNFSTKVLTDFFREIDVILPKKRVFNSSILNVMNRMHDPRDMKIVEESLIRLYPEYFSTYRKYIKKNNRYEQMVVFITKWEIFDAYCKWIFPLLNELERQINPKKNSLHTERKLAFIAEQMSPLYFHYNKYKIKHLPIALVDSNYKSKSWLRYHASNLKSTFRFIFNI